MSTTQTIANQTTNHHQPKTKHHQQKQIITTTTTITTWMRGTIGSVKMGVGCGLTPVLSLKKYSLSK
jgi:hypothetical protein